MSFSASLSLGAWIWIANGLYLVFLLLALLKTPWRILLREPRLQHLFMASVVFVALLWQLRAGINHSVSIQLLLATTLTLMFYWPMALLATSLALLGVTTVGKAPWDMLGINGLITCVLPVLVSHCIWRIMDTRLPSNFFVFIFFAGCLGAALSTLATGLAVILISYAALSAHEFARLTGEYFLLLPLLLPPELVTNGMILSGLTAYLPDWVRAFDPARYLDNK